MRQSKLRKAKAKRQRELKKKRDELTLKQYLQKCEPEFRYIVSQWAKDKTLAKVLRFFRLLEEHKCPMEPCYTPNKWCNVLDGPEILLRKAKCGVRKLNYGRYIHEYMEEDCMNKEERLKYNHATDLEHFLYDIARAHQFKIQYY